VILISANLLLASGYMPLHQESLTVSIRQQEGVQRGLRVM